MFNDKFVEFFDNLIKSSIQIKENKSKVKNNKEDDIEIINDYNLEDKEKKYIEKHITSLINTPFNKFIDNQNNEKFSTYLKLLQNIYCDISELSKIFPDLMSLKMTLKLYFISMRTLYYNNQKFSKILSANETFSVFLDFFYKDIFLYAIKIFNNIDIQNKNNINNLDINKYIINSFIGENLPFIKDNVNEMQIPLNILYNISDYRYDIMKDIIKSGKDIKNYFDKQEKYLKDININNSIYLSVIIYFLNEIKEKYFVDRFIKYLELNEEDKKIIMANIITK